MILTGFTDEVSDNLSLQIKALKALGWNHIDLRTVEGKNVGSLTDYEFDHIHGQLTENGTRISCFASTIANWSRNAIPSLPISVYMTFMPCCEIHFMGVRGKITSSLS